MSNRMRTTSPATQNGHMTRPYSRQQATSGMMQSMVWKNNGRHCRTMSNSDNTDCPRVLFKNTKTAVLDKYAFSPEFFLVSTLLAPRLYSPRITIYVTFIRWIRWRSSSSCRRWDLLFATSLIIIMICFKNFRDISHPKSHATEITWSNWPGCRGLSRDIPVLLCSAHGRACCRSMYEFLFRSSLLTKSRHVSNMYTTS